MNINCPDLYFLISNYFNIPKKFYWKNILIYKTLLLMDLVSEIKNSIISEKFNDYIAKILYDRIHGVDFNIPEYLYVTDIINPAYSYYSRKYPGTEIPEYVYERMKSGEEIHFLARQWFEKVPGFSGSEIVINGAHSGMNVIGRVDFMINDSVVEFKTKNVYPISEDSVMNVYISDLEQLLFYSVLNSNFSEINYLVFFSEMKFTVYRIKILDKKTITNEITYRVDMIKRSISNDDISGFQRCSYFSYGCPYSSAGLCKCNTLEKKSAGWFQNAIEIEEDENLEEKLALIYENQENFIDLRFYDLIYPRKYYHKINGDQQITGEVQEKTGKSFEKSNIKFALLDVIDSSLLSVSGFERAERNLVSTVNLYGDDRYIIRNMYDENSISPYILKINNSYYEGKFPETYYSELAVTCARRNIETGIIIVVYPRLNYKIVVKEVFFNNKRIIDTCRKKIDDINEAVKNKNPEILDLCPQFAIKSCSFRSCSCMKEIMKRN